MTQEASAYTYMVRCADGSLYTGWTDDLEKRMKTHNAGKASKYTRSRLPVELVASWPFDTPSEAMRWEYQLKQLSRKQKLRLISQ